MSLSLETEIRAYNDLRPQLESEYFGKWIVFRDQKLEGTFESFEDAAESAVQRFGRGPYLIRRVGASGVRLPVSLAYRGYYA